MLVAFKDIRFQSETFRLFSGNTDVVVQPFYDLHCSAEFLQLAEESRALLLALRFLLDLYKRRRKHAIRHDTGIVCYSPWDSQCTGYGLSWVARTNDSEAVSSLT